MHPVLRLVEHDRLRGFKDFLGHFISLDRRQAVHEDRALLARLRHECRIDLIRGEQFDPLGCLGFLAHGCPDIRVNDVCALHRVHILRDRDRRSRFFCISARKFDKALLRPQLLRGDDREVHAHLSASDEEGVRHVVAAVPEEDKILSGDRSELFTHGQEVREDLGRMEIVRETVPYRNA